MRIGIDFDNTIICYDQVFRQLAKDYGMVDVDYAGNKVELRDLLRSRPEGDLLWQRLQGKAYGEGISLASMFPGFKDFVAACNANPAIEIFIVSHKTELGHFDEKQINLRDAARKWLRDQGLFNSVAPFIKEANVFFASTREEKIHRIRTLQCTHFIDDLPEVLFAPQFPESIERFLFLPDTESALHAEHADTAFTNWNEIKDAIFAN